MTKRFPKVALFLGAGASRAFGYPTTLEFAQTLKKVLSNEEKRIYESMLAFTQTPDIENVLRILDLTIEFCSIPYAQALCKHADFSVDSNGGKASHLILDLNKFVSSCKNLKGTIVNELHTQYEFDRNRLSDIIAYYNSLDLILGQFNRAAKLHIFTTNYDSVFERFCIDSGREIEFTCGFSTDYRSGRQFWSPEELRNWKYDEIRSQGFWVYKLHGSLDWRETEDEKIERVPTEEKVSSRTRRYKSNILIYPAQKNYETEEPFRRLQKYFVEVLNRHKLCLVIGFSFRDPAINNVFLDFLGFNRKRRLVVVSPSASVNVDTNLVSGGEYREQIECIDKPFGKKVTFESISETLARIFRETRNEERL